MANKITTGAYVIRKKESSTVIAVEEASLSTWSWITNPEQDETEHRDQQIWWVEPLPDQESGEEEVIYSITNTSCGHALGLKTGSGKQSFHNAETYLTASPENGAPWQRWTIRGNEDDGRTYYTIASVDNGQVIGGTHESWLLTQAQVSGSVHQQWEFVIPVVAYPPGWFQIQNTKTGVLLNHTYSSNPPVLILPPSPAQQPQYRESWGNQWTLTPAKYYSSDPPTTPVSGLWCFRNRLTKSFLRNTTADVTAWETKITDIEEHTWRLELDPDCNWNIINKKTSFLLGESQVSCNSGTMVACTNKGRTSSTGWVFTSPVINTKDLMTPNMKKTR